MHANDFVVDYGAARQTVKRVAKLLPHLDGEPAATLIVESVNSIDARTLVVATEQEKVLWILDLICEEKTYNL